LFSPKSFCVVILGHDPVPNTWACATPKTSDDIVTTIDHILILMI